MGEGVPMKERTDSFLFGIISQKFKSSQKSLKEHTRSGFAQGTGQSYFSNSIEGASSSP